MAKSKATDPVEPAETQDTIALDVRTKEVFRTIGARLPAELADWVVDRANAHSCSISDIMRALVKHARAKNLV